MIAPNQINVRCFNFRAVFLTDSILSCSLHIILFPYLLYPFNQIAFMASIFMTIAIGLERFIAVHYPLNYSQTVNDNTALRRRMLKYLLPVATLSAAFNVTKFLEATYDYGN